MVNGYDFSDWLPEVEKSEGMIYVESELDALERRMSVLQSQAVEDPVSDMQSELDELDAMCESLARKAAAGDTQASLLLRNQREQKDELERAIGAALDVKSARDRMIEETKDEIRYNQRQLENEKKQIFRELYQREGPRLNEEARKAVARFVAIKQLSGTVPAGWFHNMSIFDERDNANPGKDFMPYRDMLTYIQSLENSIV